MDDLLVPSISGKPPFRRYMSKKNSQSRRRDHPKSQLGFPTAIRRRGPTCWNCCFPAEIWTVFLSGNPLVVCWCFFGKIEAGFLQQVRFGCRRRRRWLPVDPLIDGGFHKYIMHTGYVRILRAILLLTKIGYNRWSCDIHAFFLPLS